MTPWHVRRAANLKFIRQTMLQLHDTTLDERFLAAACEAADLLDEHRHETEQIEDTMRQVREWARDRIGELRVMGDAA